MYHRFVTFGVTRCLSRYQPIITGNLGRRVCTLQRNLIPATWNISSVYHQQNRFRRKGPKHSGSTQNESDSDSDVDDVEDYSKQESGSVDLKVEPGAKVITYKLESSRVDRLLRKVLNVSGKKVEDLFYEKKIQVNGKVLVKKSQQVNEGDIITVPLEDSTSGRARGALIEVLEIMENENNCSVKVLRNKNTLVSV